LLALYQRNSLFSNRQLLTEKVSFAFHRVMKVFDAKSGEIKAYREILFQTGSSKSLPTFSG
jgi:hypothetical protein